MTYKRKRRLKKIQTSQQAIEERLLRLRFMFGRDVMDEHEAINEAFGKLYYLVRLARGNDPVI